MFRRVECLLWRFEAIVVTMQCLLQSVAMWWERLARCLFESRSRVLLGILIPVHSPAWAREDTLCSTSWIDPCRLA